MTTKRRDVMEKIEIAPERVYYPMCCSLVGANVGGKPNYLAVAWFSMVHPKPPYVLVTMNKVHYTNAGIKENGTFSVNIPSAEMAEVTDYCGLVSGSKYDKSKVFETFYGKLKTAPMIKESPFSAECKLVQIVDLPMEELFIGEIIGVYTEKRYLTEGLPDIRKMNPIVLQMPQKKYVTMGTELAPAWEVGKKLIK
jgi:flavin reductase (DIM6/NTAB) family NADH-FMN oxidoreductase RutF